MKTTMRYHLTPVKLVKTQNTDAGDDRDELGIVKYCWWESKLVQPL